jgi:hypothetical protein
MARLSDDQIAQVLTRAANYPPGSHNHQVVAPLLMVIAELHTRLDERFEHGGRLPFGYIFQDGAFCVDHDQAATVQTIVALRDAGGSLRAIAAELDEQQRPTPSGGGKWQHTTVRSILANEAVYRGEVTWRGHHLPVLLERGETAPA